MQEDVAAYRRWAVEADVFEDERRVLKPVTADGYIRQIRCMISRLIEAGKPVDHFTSLHAILDPGLVKDGLRLIKGTRTLDQARPSLHAVMTAVLSVAKFKKLEPARYAEFKALADKVRHRPQGMNPKNKVRLDALRSDDARQRLFELPVQVARRLAGKHQPTIREAQTMQHACMLELLLHMPVRVKNLASLDLERHVTRAAHDGMWRIAIPADEVKNEQPIDCVLNAESSGLLATYVTRFRPVLQVAPSTALFISQSGRRKGEHALSRQFAAFIKRELGLTINPHLMRHLAALTYLEDCPGDYETVRQLLAHRQIATTITFYAAGAETTSALARYDDVLARRRAERTARAPAKAARAVMRRADEEVS